MDLLQALFLLLVFLPVFFLLSGSIFTSHSFYYDAQANLLLLPLPIGSVFCFLGIAFLLRLEKKHFGMGVIFSIFTLMVFSVIVSSGESDKADLAKFILLAQFVLPIFGFVLGSLYLSPKSDYLRYEAIALYVLLLIIPLEVIATLMKGNGQLYPNLYVFSLYQHLQYLPVIFVGLYFLTINSLHQNNRLRILVLFLAPWMGIYLAASLSILAMVLGVLGVIVSLWFSNKSSKRWYVIIVVIFLCSSFTIYYPNAQATSTYALKFSNDELAIHKNETITAKEISIQEHSPFDELLTALPNNLTERFHYWRFYGEGIFESPKIFLFGHPARPDRNTYPSAHNYYLDLIYHFGIITSLPIIYLIFVTMRNCFRVMVKGKLTSELAMTMVLVGFFVFIDNSLKVGFRQPYSGMVMFFLWGVLLIKLSNYDEKRTWS